MAEKGPNFGYTDEGKKPTRRKFLQFLGGTVALGAGIWGLERLQDKNPRNLELEYEEKALKSAEVKVDPKEYKEGDTITTPVTEVEVSGFRLLFQPMGMASYAFRGSAGEVKHGYSFRVKNQGELQAAVSHFIGQTQADFYPPAKEVKKGVFDFFEIVAMPGLKGEITLDLYIYTEQGASLEQEVLLGKKLPTKTLPSEIYRYKIKPKIYTHKASGEALRVLSETALKREDLQVSHNVHKLMSKFGELGPLYILNGEKKDQDFSAYEALSDQAVVSGLNFTKPDFEKNGEATVVHELAHNLVQNSKLSGPQMEAWKNLQNLHKTITEKAGNKTLREFSGFRVFREGSYVLKEGKEIRDGHPEDNANELFASAVVVLRYFAKDFADRFSSLDPVQKQLAAETVRKVLDFLKAMNSSRQVLTELLPDLETIEKLS